MHRAAADTLEDADAVRWHTSSLVLQDAAQGIGPLALRHCVPQAVPVCGQVVLAGAMGVPQRYYTVFAQWLATLGWKVTTFDYRGHAESLHGPLRQVQANVLDWAQDCAAVAQHVRQQHPQLPLYWIGHSVGAQLPGMCTPALPIDGLLAIASGSGYWRENALPTKRKVLLWWHVVAPVVTAVCGCLPGKKWGLVGDLPAGVVWQWRRWCLHPQYAIGVEGAAVRMAYAAARYPLHALVVDDDEMMSQRSTASLLGWYSHCPHTMQRLRAHDVPGGRIGHFGFFRSRMQTTLWLHAQVVLGHWLQAHHTAQAMTPTGQPSGGAGSTVSKIERRAVVAPNRHGQADLFSENPLL